MSDDLERYKPSTESAEDRKHKAAGAFLRKNLLGGSSKRDNRVLRIVIHRNGLTRHNRRQYAKSLPIRHAASGILNLYLSVALWYKADYPTNRIDVLTLKKKQMRGIDEKRADRRH